MKHVREEVWYKPWMLTHNQVHRQVDSEVWHIVWEHIYTKITQLSEQRAGYPFQWYWYIWDYVGRLLSKEVS